MKLLGQFNNTHTSMVTLQTEEENSSEEQKQELNEPSSGSSSSNADTPFPDERAVENPSLSEIILSEEQRILTDIESLNSVGYGFKNTFKNYIVNSVQLQREAAKQEIESLTEQLKQQQLKYNHSLLSKDLTISELTA